MDMYLLTICMLRFSDGKLDIVVPSFVHYLEVLEGSDGEKMPGNLLFSILKRFVSPV